MSEPTLDDVIDRLDGMNRRINSMDQRLERVEGCSELTSQRLSLLHERLDLMDLVSKQRFDTLEKVVVEIRDSLNGHGS